jgi:hypothetical protein
MVRKKEDDQPGGERLSPLGIETAHGSNRPGVPGKADLPFDQ